MGSNFPSSMQGGLGLYGSGVNLCSTGAPFPVNQPAVVVDKLLVFGHGIDMREHKLLIAWLGADAVVVFEELTSHQYNEIIIMKMKLPKMYENLAKELIHEYFPTRLTPNGRITNLNDLSEEQNEPQGLSGQADAGEPDAG